MSRSRSSCRTCRLAAGAPRRKGAAGAGEAARGGAGVPAAAAAQEAGAVRHREPGAPGRAGRRGPAADGAEAESGALRKSGALRESGTLRAAEAQADQGPGSHPRPVGVPHPVGGLDADRGHGRIRRATCRAQRAGPASGPPAGRDRAAVPRAGDRIRGRGLGADGQSRGTAGLRPDQRLPRRWRVHGPGAARAARLAVHASPGAERGDPARGDRLGGPAHRRARAVQYRQGHAESFARRAGDQGGGRAYRLRGLRAAGDRAHPMGGDAAARPGGLLRAARAHWHAGAARAGPAA